MIKISIERFPGETVNVEWPAVPRIGDSVDLNDPDVDAEALRGIVKTVVWWRDGSVRVVLAVRP